MVPSAMSFARTVHNRIAIQMENGSVCQVSGQTSKKPDPRL